MNRILGAVLHLLKYCDAIFIYIVFSLLTNVRSLSVGESSTVFWLDDLADDVYGLIQDGAAHESLPGGVKLEHFWG